MPDAPFTVPYPQHPHFVGREEDLARLHAALQGEGPVGINPAAMGNPTGVTGQGGIGKTQLAVAYAYRYRDDYPDGVYWINGAESLWSEFVKFSRHFPGQGYKGQHIGGLRETLRSRFSIEEVRDLCLDLGINYEEFSPQLGISGLARELVTYCKRHGQVSLLEERVLRLRGEPLKLQTQDELVLHGFAWLRAHPHSLLIIDNVADPAALEQPLTRDCIPGRLPCSVLFTTRRRDLGRFRPVELKTLPPNAALRLLLRDPRRAAALDPNHPEHSIAADICAVFGYLPLALEIAAAHLANHSSAPLAAYRAELRRRGALDVIADKRVSVVTRHETGLAAALAAQWTTLGKEAQMLLRVAGQMSEAAYLPVARLGLLAGVPAETASFFDVTLHGALAELRDTSLAEELAGDQVRLHPLVREFARDRTSLAEKADFRTACVDRLLSAFGDIKTLEQQVDARGIDAILRDLLVAQEMFGGQGPSHTLRNLRVLLRVLRRDAHHLRGWQWDSAPGFLAQQLRLRLFNNPTQTLFRDLAGHLRQSGPTWLPRWTAHGESSGLEMTLTGHEGWAQTVAVMLDGRHVVSGGSDGTLRVWSLDTGEMERSLAGYEDGVNVVAMTPDGRRAVSGGGGGTLRVWNLDTGKMERTLDGHRGRVRAIAVTSDGWRAVSGRDDQTLHVWNLDTGQMERTLTGHGGRLLTSVLAVALTQDGRRAVSGGDDGTLHVWNLDTGQLEQKLAGNMLGVRAVAVTPDGRRALSGGGDGTLRVWNLDTGQLEQKLAGNMQGVRAVAVTPDGRRAVSGGDDGTLCVWNLDTSQSERKQTGHRGKVLAVAVTPDGRRAVSGGDDGTLCVWSLGTSQSGRKPTGHRGGVRAVAVTPDGRWVISVGGDQTLRVWDADTGRSEWTLAGHGDTVRTVAATPDGRWFVSGGIDGILRLWNLVTGEVERTLPRHGGAVHKVAVTPDGRRTISGEFSGTLRVYDLETGEMERTLTGHEGGVGTVVLTPDGRRAISGGRGGTLHIWNLDTGEVERMLAGHKGGVWAVAITPDGRRAVSGGDDLMMRVWNLGTGEVEGTLDGHKDAVQAVAVIPDGRRAVSGGRDGTLRMWDLYTDRELGRAALDAAVTCVAVAPGNPPLVITGDTAGNVYCLEWVE